MSPTTPSSPERTDSTCPATRRGYTPRELAKILRVSRDKIRTWIESGELPALNTAASRPRFIVLPEHLKEFERSRRAATPTPTPRRRRASVPKDYYPD